MQLLIVHRDPEMGEALMRMIKSHTRHHCEHVKSDQLARDWAQLHPRCELLLVQLEAEGIDGLALGAEFSEAFPGLQILFLPAYSGAERRLEIAQTKVFPEPIEGDELLSAIERAGNAPSNAPDLFHVVDVVQMCCLSGRSGALQMVKESKSGLVFLRNGQIVDAETTAARGREALAEIIQWRLVEFAYEPTVRPPLETVTGPWDENLTELINPEKQENAVESERRSA